MFIGLHTRDIIMVQVRLRAMYNCGITNQDFVTNKNPQTKAIINSNDLHFKPELLSFNCTIQKQEFLFSSPVKNKIK